MSIEHIVGEVPEWYGEIQHAWFAKKEACEEGRAIDFDGYIRLEEALDDNPSTDASDWEILSVDDVEDCTIYWPEDEDNS